MKRLTLLALIVVLSTTTLFAKGKKTLKLSIAEVHKVELATGQDSASYALGLYTGSQIAVAEQVLDGLDMEALASVISNAKPSEKTIETYRGPFGELDQDILMAGITNQILGDTTILTMEKANVFLQAYSQRVAEEAGEKNLEEGRKFLEENKTKEGVVALASGLQYKVIEEGNGAKPSATDRVKVDYVSKLIDGTVFDSSVERGEPVVLGVSQVIPGWTEALQLMPVGSKWELYIPSDLAYGSQGAGGGIEPNATLIFEVELYSIE